MARMTILLTAVVAALLGAQVAQSSFIVSRNTSHVTLRVEGGKAIVNYRQKGAMHHVVLWGAINARPPSRSVKQVAFAVRYGKGRLGGGACARYTGPPLVFLVAACDAPDGSYWALQAWRRLSPNYGGTTGAVELHASHWRGQLPILEVWQDWAYKRYDHLFGRLTYQGQGVYGFHSTRTGRPLDTYGRNLYLDTLDSAYGKGWHRENSFLAHRPNGTFCYGFFPHGKHPAGAGSEYRLTVEGPGVTPVVSWRGASPGPYDAATASQMAAVESSLDDPVCRPHG